MIKKIKMTAQAFTNNGLFEPGQILTDDQYSQEFLHHLANQAKAAEVIETKMLAPVEENKTEKPQKPLPKKKVEKKKKQ